MKRSFSDCPKCRFHYHEPFEECPRCGVVVWRFQPGPDDLDGALSSASDSIQTQRVWWKRFTASFLEAVGTSLHPISRPGLMGRGALWLILLIWSLMLMTSPIEGNSASTSVLHLVNLPFHEAGHIFFSPFGRFVQSLGGTLGQLLIPLICLAVLLVKTRDPFGAGICLWWFGENFLDIAPYINDARAGVLPLLGGNFGHSAPYGFHDWEYLLNESGMLVYDHTIARASAMAGSLLMLLALAWMAGILLTANRSLKAAELISSADRGTSDFR